MAGGQSSASPERPVASLQDPEAPSSLGPPWWVGVSGTGLSALARRGPRHCLGRCPLAPVLPEQGRPCAPPPRALHVAAAPWSGVPPAAENCPSQSEGAGGTRPSGTTPSWCLQGPSCGQVLSTHLSIYLSAGGQSPPSGLRGSVSCPGSCPCKPGLPVGRCWPGQGRTADLAPTVICAPHPAWC